ncbi:hypothetical protein BSG1_04970 [Bacillus sp. SG-1]|nr:hypothetical protein BSG1_04970 [Bacillus sp. SG-1]
MVMYLTNLAQEAEVILLDLPIVNLAGENKKIIQ